ncbi:MAG: BTAD domain-containing putative transcriptional regulator [Gemmatimonadaceae bacterium]
MSLQLKLFGGLSLIDSAGGNVRVTRRHRLAVLAILATNDRPVPRERLLALLWPDSNDESARHALGQLLYGLRQDVALANLISGATDLSLHRSLIECDLWTFREALKQGDHRLAMQEYVGPFLDGVQIPNAGAFDRWCDEERRTLAQTANDALQTLAAAADTRGDVAEAVTWWRRLTLEDPLSSRVALGYMRALVAAGDRAAAVQHARVHNALVRAELETDADAAVMRYAEELRAVSPAELSANAFAVAKVAPITATAIAAVPQSEAPTGDQPATAAATAVNNVDTAPELPLQAGPSSTPTATIVEPTRKNGRYKGLAIGALFAFSVVIAVVLRNRTHPDAIATTTNGVPVVAVFPFAVRGDSARAFLGEALAALLSGRLDAPGVLRTVEANAVLSTVGEKPDRTNNSATVLNALGATVAVTGTVVVLGDRVEIDAEMRNAGDASARVVRAHVAGAVDSLFALADQLGASLLVAREGRALGSTALGGTASVLALKALLAGERALRDWHLFDAIAAYKNALAIDSTYAFAWYRLAFTEGWAGVDVGRSPARANALRFSKQLPERYALLVAATAKFSMNDPAAERELLTLVQRYPDDADAWSELAEYRMHVGPLFGQPTTNAEAPLRRTLALDSLGHPEVRWHLSQLAMERGDEAEARKIVAPLLALPSQSDRIIRGLVLALALTSRSAVAETALVRGMREDSPRNTLRSLLMAVGSVGVTATARAVADSVASPGSSRQHQAAGLTVLMQMNAAQNRVNDVVLSGSLLAAIDSVAAANSWGDVAQLFDFQAPVAIWKNAGDVLERAAMRDTSDARWNRLAVAAILADRASDNGAFTRRLRALELKRHMSVSDSVTMRTLRAAHASATGDSIGEARELHDLTGPLEWQFTRTVRARWLERVGNYEEAERWYLSAPWGPQAVLLSYQAYDKASQLEARRGNQTLANVFAQRAAYFQGRSTTAAR